MLCWKVGFANILNSGYGSTGDGEKKEIQMKHEFDYDYFVIGAGSGGVRSARIAARMAPKLALPKDDFWAEHV